jgi:hypothetical protein
VKEDYGSYIVTVRGSVEVGICSGSEEAIKRLLTSEDLLDLLDISATCARPQEKPKKGKKG